MRDPLPSTQSAQHSQASPSYPLPVQRQQIPPSDAAAQVPVGSVQGGSQLSGRDTVLRKGLDNGQSMHGHARQEQLLTEDEVLTIAFVYVI